ncbi:MAG: hypothetical protein LBR41_00880 [Rickettsiales bacterium]|jgi:hypothetical protein|nr:hypothetical protein [Rickettsiales bacterium]
MRKFLLSTLFSFIAASAAHAVCPVCTIAVGAGLEGARLLGVDDVITGIWAGAFTLMLVFWTAKWLSRRGVKSAIWYFLDFVFYYALVACVYLLPGMTFGANTLWGIDKFLIGLVVGTIALWIADYYVAKSVRKFGGKSRFKFQKVIVPVGTLLILSLIFWGITTW